MAKIAILGLGTVGSGVAEVLATNAASIEKKCGETVSVKYILGRHAYPDSPYGHLVVQDFDLIENDPEITVVAECIGGTSDAKDYTVRALKAGKHVVTSNKEVVAEHGPELLKLAREMGVRYLFEASVGGGIPIIRPLSTCLGADEVSEVYGILNGTTNYILTKMIKEGLSFDTALKQAQELGYAEADPTADVEGHDACRKTCILSALAFGHHVYPRQVPTTGISGITAEDVANAAEAGMKIKLLGRAVKNGDTVTAYVSPHLLPEDHPLAGVDDVFNGIVVRGNAVGDLMFYGRGAGKLPTASAVAADVVDVILHPELPTALWSEDSGDYAGDLHELRGAWYIRGTIPAAVPVEKVLGEEAYLTAPMTRSELAACLGPVPCTVLPVLS